MSNIIDSIQLSGVTYTIQGSGGGGNPTVELTQAEYDALVESGAVQTNTYYIITDAQAGDLTQYWTSAQTQSAITEAVSGKASQSDLETVSGAVAGKQDQLVSGTNIKTINNESILGSGNIDIQGGGGKAIEAGRGIAITTGATADTVSFNLPISAGTGSDSLVFCRYGAATGQYSTAFGNGSQAGNNYAFAIGNGNYANGPSSFAGGDGLTSAIGGGSFAFGYNAETRGYCSVALGGYFLRTNNESEIALGISNVSNTGSTDADKTIFSVGNGTNSSNRHNAFEIRQNGDIYLTKDGQDVKLQDQLGGGGSITIDPSLDSGSTNAVANSAITQAVSSKINQNDSLFTIRTNMIEFVILSGGNKSRLIFAFDIIQNNQIVLSTDTVNDKNALLSSLTTLGFDNKIYLMDCLDSNDYTSSTSYYGEIGGHKCYAVLLGYTPDFNLKTIGLKRNNTIYSLDKISGGKYNYNYLTNKPTITTSVTSASTDSQVPSAKAVYDQLGGLKLVKLSQSDYDALATKDDNTVYFIGDSTNGYTMKIGSANVN